MFFDLDLKGNRLPPKTVCLSYDDGPGRTTGAGPGPHTLELGQFLYEEGISAAFFVVGKHAEEHVDILASLRGCGHLVGNHTYNHPGLVALAQAGGDVVGEVERTDALIRPFVEGPHTFFRPPYGNWREKTAPGSPVDKATSIVAEILNKRAQLSSYVGPVNWDISNEDWNCWRDNRSPAECAEGFLRKIEALGQGIVLMHDSSDDAELRARNGALPMTKVLVSALKARGYRFIRLDAIPQVQSATRVVSQVYLKTPDGRFALTRHPADDRILLQSVEHQPAECFGLVPLESGQVALRAAHGQFLSRPDGGCRTMVAQAPTADAAESLTLESLGQDRIALRTRDRRYLAPADGALQPCKGHNKAQASFVIEPRFGQWPLE